MRDTSSTLQRVRVRDGETPQPGASREMVEDLEAALAQFPEIAEELKAEG